MLDKNLIEKSAKIGYSIAMNCAGMQIISENFTWENEPEFCKELWRDIAKGILSQIEIQSSKAPPITNPIPIEINDAALYVLNNNPILENFPFAEVDLNDR